MTDPSAIDRPVEPPPIDPAPFLWDAMAMVAIAGIIVAFFVMVPS